VTVVDVASAAASAPNVVQALAVASLYWITKPVSSDDSSFQERATLVALAAVAVSPVGGGGGIVRDTVELGVEPLEFLAATRNWYVVLAVRPVTVADRAFLGAVAVAHAVERVRYWISKPVSSVELSVQVTVAVVDPVGVTETPEGAAGGSLVPPVETMLEGVESPLALVAMTRNS